MRRHDLVGRILGIVVFLGGIGLLVFVFVTAYSFFNSPQGHIASAPAPGANTPATAQLGQSVLTILVRIGLLVVMTIVGSMLAGRGAQLYLASLSQGRADSETVIEE